MPAIRLEGLAEEWEGASFIRQTAREHRQLIKWPNPQAVGIPSMKLVPKLIQKADHHHTICGL